MKKQIVLYSKQMQRWIITSGRLFYIEINYTAHDCLSDIQCYLLVCDGDLRNAQEQLTHFGQL